MFDCVPKMPLMPEKKKKKRKEKKKIILHDFT